MIRATLTSTISYPEILWTVASVLATFYVGKLTRRAVGNLRHLREMGWNGTREDAGRISIVIFGSLFFIESINVIIGIAAMTAPTPERVDEPGLVSYVLVTGFIAEAVFVAGIAYLIDRMQVALVRRIEEGLKQQEDTGQRRRKGD